MTIINTNSIAGINSITAQPSQPFSVYDSDGNSRLYVDIYGIVSDSQGKIRSIPQNSKTSSYTLIANDNGKHISITTGGITVPSSVFSVGDNIVIFNDSTSNQTITQGTSVTMYLAGTATTGNRTLAQRGICTILCVSSNTFVIYGNGLT